MNSLSHQNNFRKIVSIQNQESNQEPKFRKSFNARLGNDLNENSYIKRIPGHDMVQYE